MTGFVRHTFGKARIGGRALTIGLLAGGTLAACLSSPSSARAAEDCTAPTTAAGWQAVWDQLGFVGDGNFSTALPDGRSAWVTGDSVPRAGGPWASNTVTVVDGSCTRQTANAVPDAADGTAYWPGPVAVVRGQVMSVGSRIRRTPGEGFGFAPVRSEVAAWSLPAGAWTPQLAGLTPAPASPVGVRWSTGIWTDGRTVYVWGSTDGWPGAWGVDAYLARIPASSFPAGAWSYWTRPGVWSADPAAARPLLSAAAGWGTDTAFSATRSATGSWRLYTRRGGAWGGEHGEVVGRPGAWCWRPRGTEPGYLAASHPEAPLADGRLLVTVNVAGVGAQFLEVAVR